jgi:hypothetical protein
MVRKIKKRLTMEKETPKNEKYSKYKNGLEKRT